MSHQSDNIFAGTQVVSLAEVRGTNNSLVHPCGAVDVITRRPTGDRNQFLVHFPDGFETMLMGAATLRDARAPVCVEMQRDRLLAVKRGELPWTDVDAWRKELHCDFERALAGTKLPERPDYGAANGFLLKARREMARD